MHTFTHSHPLFSFFFAHTHSHHSLFSLIATGHQSVTSTKNNKNTYGSVSGSPPGVLQIAKPNVSSRGRGRGMSESSDKDSIASSRHRELHKTLEKNRRAHLRHCFEQLKTELPRSEYNDKKTSHINIIHCAIR